MFNLHRLGLEDVVHIPQRSEVEQYQDVSFTITQLPQLTKQHDVEQISFLLPMTMRLPSESVPPNVSIRYGIEFSRPESSFANQGGITYFTLYLTLLSMPIFLYSKKLAIDWILLTQKWIKVLPTTLPHAFTQFDTMSACYDA